MDLNPSQEAFGEKMGTHQWNISRWERVKRAEYYGVLPPCRFSDVSLDYFIERKEY